MKSETEDAAETTIGKQAYRHIFDADKLEDIKAEAAEKGQTTELFLTELVVRIADVTQDILIPSWADISMQTVGDKLTVCMEWK